MYRHYQASSCDIIVSTCLLNLSLTLFLLPSFSPSDASSHLLGCCYFLILSPVIAWISHEQYCFRIQINDCISPSGLTTTGTSSVREKERRVEEVEFETVTGLEGC